jgi:hypothetical protein
VSGVQISGRKREKAGAAGWAPAAEKFVKAVVKKK